MRISTFKEAYSKFEPLGFPMLHFVSLFALDDKNESLSLIHNYTVFISFTEPLIFASLTLIAIKII